MGDKLFIIVEQNVDKWPFVFDVRCSEELVKRKGGEVEDATFFPRHFVHGYRLVERKRGKEVCFGESYNPEEASLKLKKKAERYAEEIGERISGDLDETVYIRRERIPFGMFFPCRFFAEPFGIPVNI